jgi:thiol-disulfide isomerase/thioredoxin
MTPGYKRLPGAGSRAGILPLVCLILGAAFAPVRGAPQAGSPAPDFTLPGLLAGQGEVGLRSLTGQVVVADFWASWCPPCRKTLPHLGRLAAAHPSLAVLAISVDESREKAVDFLKVREPSLIYLHDAGQSAASAYDPGGMPSLVLIDKRGVLRHRYDGYTERDFGKIAAQIRSLMEEK